VLIWPNIDPVAFRIGPVAVHWYGISYLVGFSLAWWLGRSRASRPGSGWTAAAINDLLFYFAMGVILGGRVGYMLFYGLDSFFADPLALFRVWEGGMSFHGGLLGVLLAVALYGRKTGKAFFQITDFIAPLVPVGLATGRLGNFIGGELWGRPTDLPWGMVFPHVDALPRHPSQLYQFALEGVVLFLVLWFWSARPRPTMAVSGLFAILYGIFRFSVEFARQPDAHLGYVAFGWMTMGQALSLPLLGVGVTLMVLAYRKTG
jgi:phosphatidylglycerol:prolipoprotein diacylglycerol transferase